MTLEQWKQELKENYEETVAWRRHMHAHPEPSFEEEETARFIKGKLESFGIDDIQTDVGNGHGIVAKIKGSHPGPTIALRADFDALRVNEEVDSPFKSTKPGVMHACGHDGHTASLLSVAKVMAKRQEELHGNIVLIHQHAEEVLPGGAKSMVEAGALKEVDYVFGIHLGSTEPLNTVYYNWQYGSANSDSFTLKIQGKGGHGAAPHDTHDALTVGTQIVTNLQQIVSRMTDPVKPAVLTFAGFQSGGEAYNIIADTTEIKGTVRTLHADIQELVEGKLKSMSEHIAAAYDATIDLIYTRGYPAIENTPEVVEKVQESLLSSFPEEEVAEVKESMGGEDFAYFLKDKPGAFLRVGACPPGKTDAYPHHHPKFEIDERSLLRSGEVFLTLIDTYLQG
ncbi:Catalyzes the cleavage of p-aminobenzoyl-glutamate to p-aminobenzoate and glutamate, subunit A [Alkalibacterium sp. AK22]|uniref:M20 metallopeptidase family protein n=1 Tax=Alkalibacterium sp. AK22 TaxID=1229520 RepID=UPI00044AE958|nr:amidohydrolase [Alkalibacterium sp. AK22]EXJ24050.1 Catalyzes the cleavage of p-aminobenzoyl-glutamate to p-aminobenzoate and glutamate, subunit A [Alkalibacterium sp. AK22]